MPEAAVQPDGVTVVLTTAPDMATAERLAGELVDERLVACANIVPSVRSIYRWEGAVRSDDEVLMVLKTTEDRCGLVRARIETLHPYDVPEVLGLPVTSGSAAYLGWIRDEVAGSR